MTITRSSNRCYGIAVAAATSSNGGGSRNSCGTAAAAAASAAPQGISRSSNSGMEVAEGPARCRGGAGSSGNSSRCNRGRSIGSDTKLQQQQQQQQWQQGWRQQGPCQLLWMSGLNVLMMSGVNILTIHHHDDA